LGYGGSLIILSYIRFDLAGTDYYMSSYGSQIYGHFDQRVTRTQTYPTSYSVELHQTLTRSDESSDFGISRTGLCSAIAIFGVISRRYRLGPWQYHYDDYSYTERKHHNELTDIGKELVVCLLQLFRQLFSSGTYFKFVRHSARVPPKPEYCKHSLSAASSPQT
jgi:hypothetical protein